MEYVLMKFKESENKKDELKYFKERIKEANIIIEEILNKNILFNKIKEFAQEKNVVILFHDKINNEYIYCTSSSRVNSIIVDLTEELELNAEHCIKIKGKEINSKYELGFCLVG